ncbi:MAG: hypothetical protein WDW38_005463 [Sanguina aurantia]
MSTPKLTIKYFDIAGRAEAARLLLAMGNVPFTDEFLEGEAFAALKPLCPFGQVPVLQIGEDGKLLAQSGAINLYCAKLAKLYPEDPVDAAFCDMVVCQASDCFEPLLATMGIKDPEAKLQTRADLVKPTGQVGARINSLSAYLTSLKSDFFGGATPDFADVIVYQNFSFIQSGFLDGVPLTVLADFPVIKAHHARMAAYPSIAEYYKRTNNPKRLGLTTVA